MARFRKKKAPLKVLSLEDSLILLLEKSNNQPLSIKSILEILSGNGRYLLIILFALPFCQPIQIPGLSLPFGLAIALIGIRSAFGHRIWLPTFILSKEIQPDTLKKIVKNSLRLLEKMKKWIHPRLSFFCSHPHLHLLNGLVIAFLGIFLALPLPIPLSNLLAGWGILFMGLGMLKKDGLLVCLSYVLCLAVVLFFIAIGFFLNAAHSKSPIQN